MTPAAYVEARARRGARGAALETAGRAGRGRSPRGCGFGTAETMRRAFQRALGVGPAAYRAPLRTPPEHEEHDHEHRHPALRPLHRARRHRALRGALPPAGRARARSSPPSPARSRTDNGMLRIVAETALDERAQPRDRRRPRRHRDARADERRARCSTGCASAHEHERLDDARSAPARWCSARPACSTGSSATTHWLAMDTLAATRRAPDGRARGRAGQDHHRRRRVGRHRHGASRSRRRSRATTSRRRSSSASSTTRSRRSTPARPRRRPSTSSRSAAASRR